MADKLKDTEIETGEFALETYGDGDGKLDGSNLGKFMYCMGINPSLEYLKGAGMTEKEGEKKLTLDECLNAYAELKKSIKDFGCYEDFIECLKLYDKNENGFMLVGELSHSLLTLGEKLNDAEVDEVFEQCLDEENDDGEIPYIPFLRRMCELDPPLKPKKK
ncbi:myosin light chain alkali-like [Diabrotica virgifera virgifera]|uniref:Myosin light chain alkali n=1 Tax=Diabrotica virgifera virgifera TaxID=50390 RepID=A0A6P7FUE1_DIAVI|nr:myosin light chain alkali-like [Diabrotica virgifera virgifera]